MHFKYLLFLLSLKIISDSATPWIVGSQAPLSMRFPRQESGVGYHFLLQGILPTQGLSLGSPALGGGFFTTAPPGKSILNIVKREKCRNRYKI